MQPEAVYGVLIPFLGTSLGAACVFFLKKSLGDLVQRALTGFAAGVMVAASIWSLLIPAIEQSAELGPVGLCPGGGGILGRRAVSAGAGPRQSPTCTATAPADRGAEEPAPADHDDGPGRDPAQHPGGHGRGGGVCRVSGR